MPARIQIGRRAELLLGGSAKGERGLDVTAALMHQWALFWVLLARRSVLQILLLVFVTERAGCECISWAAMPCINGLCSGCCWRGEAFYRSSC